MVLLFSNRSRALFRGTSTTSSSVYYQLLVEQRTFLQPFLPTSVTSRFGFERNQSEEELLLETEEQHLLTSIDSDLHRKQGMCRQINVLCTPEDDTTVDDLSLVVRGIAKIFVIVLFFSIAQLGLSSTITRANLPWRLTAILLYIANILVLQVVGLEPSITGCSFALFTVLGLFIFDLADFLMQILVSSTPYWSIVSLIAAVFQVINLYVLSLLRKKLIIIKQHADDALHLPQPGGIEQTGQGPGQGVEAAVGPAGHDPFIPQFIQHQQGQQQPHNDENTDNVNNILTPTPP